MAILVFHWSASGLDVAFWRPPEGVGAYSSSQGTPAISAAHLATPLVQHIAAKGVPGLACEDRRVGANRGALS